MTILKKKYYAYILDGDLGIVDSWPECQKIVSGKKANFKSFPNKEEAMIWLKDPKSYKDNASTSGKSKKKNKYYAYKLIACGKTGIVTSWDQCKSIIATGKANYKSFKTEKEAKEWLDLGGRYLSEEEIRKNLPEGIYFDAGTGRGIGVEVRVTDKMGNSILHKLLSEDKINPYGNYLTDEGSTNNFGELLGIYCALKIAIHENILSIYGDSKLVIEYWSKGYIKRGEQKEKTLELADLVVKLRKNFEVLGGKVEHVSGDINPADLGFHK